jgi:small subunit ribosomal protein S8
MSVSDPVADMLTKIRNAGMAKHERVDISTSRLKLEIIKILKIEGYIRNYKVDPDGSSVIKVFLKKNNAAGAAIHGIEKVSKPGRRVYMGYKNMPRVYNGYGTLIVSTSRGVITGRKAAEEKVGGEVICTVW